MNTIKRFSTTKISKFSKFIKLNTKLSVKHSLDAKCSNQEILACTKSKLKASFHNYLHLLHKYV